MKDSVLGLKDEYIKDERSESKIKTIKTIVLVLLVVGLLLGLDYYFVYYRYRVKPNYQATSIACVNLDNHACNITDVSSDDIKLSFVAKTFKSSSRFDIYIKDVCYHCEVGSTTSKDFRFFYFNDDEYALLPEGYTSGYQLIKKNIDETLIVELNYRYIIERSAEEPLDSNEWITYIIVFEPIE